MRVGWLIPTTGCFGAVREMVEVSNALIRRGHQVTIYSPAAQPIVWLPSLAQHGDLNAAREAEPDALLGILDWQPELYDVLLASTARLKGVCIMGVMPTPQAVAILRGETVEGADPALLMLRDAIGRGMLLVPDSQYQCDWIERELGVPAGPPIGGINPRMFRPARKPAGPPWRVLSSGDPRPRKGSDTVSAALDILRRDGLPIAADSYWGRRFNQAQLARFVAGGHVFVDGHRRGGWCNPVVEAMACGTATVCTAIGATADFARDGETALVVPPDDPEAMAAAVRRLLADPDLRARIAEGGRAFVQRFDYEFIGERLATALSARLHWTG